MRDRRLTIMILTAIAVVLAAVAATGIARAEVAPIDTEWTVVDSDRYYPGDYPDPIAECLVAHGYTGIAGDGEEVIYAPREYIEWCRDYYPRITGHGPVDNG